MKTIRKPKLWEALIPIVFLTLLLSLNVWVFGTDALDGSNQIVLILSAAAASLVAMKLGYQWVDIQKGIIKSIGSAMGSILILFMIGSLAGTWLLSGVVPAMIYYGIQILNPTLFLFAACLVSIIVSLATGSSWTTAATVGISLMGIGQTMGISEGLVAGAVLSGAYFGDKMSPLSDTTNLAPAMAGTDLFTHIRYMTITTLPSIILTLVIFLLIGFNLSIDINTQRETDIILATIKSHYHIHGWLFLVPCVVVILILRKVQALPALFIGTLLGAAFALFFQPDLVAEIGGNTSFIGYFKGIMKSMYGTIAIITPNAMVNELFTSSGMKGMFGTIWLIFSAMIFGGVMERTGMLKCIALSIISKVNSLGGLISSTVGTCVFFNLTASDQYLAIVVPGRMYAQSYKDKGLAPENLSRTLEDSGTVTSVLIPWNTCGAYHASVLKVPTLTYLPFCFFNIISPFMTILIGYLSYKIRRLNSKPKAK